MKTFVSISLLAAASAFAITADAAPPKPPTPASAASTPSVVIKNVPRATTPSEAAEKAALPGELRPENPVVPQLQIPLGRAASEPVVVSTRNRPAVRGGIDDAAARCLAQATDIAREACHAQAAQQARK